MGKVDISEELGGEKEFMPGKVCISVNAGPRTSQCGMNLLINESLGIVSKREALFKFA